MSKSITPPPQVVSLDGVGITSQESVHEVPDVTPQQVVALLQKKALSLNAQPKCKVVNGEIYVQCWFDTEAASYQFHNFCEWASNQYGIPVICT